MALNRLIKSTGFLTIALTILLSAGVIIVSLILGHSLMGSRSAMTTPALEIVEAVPIDAYIEVKVRNNDSNPVIGETGYRLMSENNTVLYESAPADFGPLPPGETAQLSFDLPPNRPANTTIQGWAHEQIAYLDTLQPEGLSLRNRLNQSLRVDQAALEADGGKGYHLTASFQLTNTESKANQYRYAVGLTSVEVQNGTPVPKTATRFSSFTEISLAASETQTIDFEENGLSIEPGMYSVSVWIQKRSESGTFVQQEQGTFSQDVIVS